MRINISRIGWAAIACGCVTGAYFALLFDVSVEAPTGNRIVNLGLISDRQSGLMLAALLIAVGAIVGFGARGRSLRVAPWQWITVAVLLAGLIALNAQAIWIWLVLHLLPS